MIFLPSAPCHAIVFFLGVPCYPFSFGRSSTCFFFLVLFTMKHYGHSSPCYCLHLGVPRHASACFWALLTMLVLVSRHSLPWFFSGHSSPCYCLLLIIPHPDAGFGHSLMCCLLLGVFCHAITFGPHCIVVVACTRWSCCSRFQGSQIFFPIQLV